VNRESLALEIIDQVARGGDSSSIFLTHPHTFNNFRSAHFLPGLIDRQRFTNWDQEGALDTYARCNARARELLEKHEVTPKADQVLTQVEEVLDPPPLSMTG
jgi:trimethylamine--corrinoid protein Co-methyltransferase